MKCIILCAGYATRLYPLTENYPKALLEIKENKTVLDYILDKIFEVELIDEIYLVANDKFYQTFKDYNKHDKVIIVNDKTTDNERRLGVIGDIKYVVDKYNLESDTLVIAGDTLFDYSLEDVVSYFDKVNSSVVVSKIENDLKTLQRSGVVKIDTSNKIVEFEEKPSIPSSNIIAYATYIYTKDIIEYLKNKDINYFSREKPLIEYIYKFHDVYCFNTEKEVYDIGTHDSLNKVRKLYKKKKK